MAVECFHTLKGYHLGIKDMNASWYWDGKVWRRLTRKDFDAEWFCEDYVIGVACQGDLLANWCEYLPGVQGWDDYGDFSVTFNMEEVEAAGWDEPQLINMLNVMAHNANHRKVLQAHDAPYQWEGTDAWGHKHMYWRYPALKPLDGMRHRDYPAELEPTGFYRPI